MSVKHHPPERYRAIVRRLMASGLYKPVAPFRGHCDFAGSGNNRCEAPVLRDIRSVVKLPAVYYDGPDAVDLRRMFIDFEVRCRKCPSCLKARGILWRIRAQEEVALSHRTWFCTFTLSPESHSAMLNRVLLSGLRRGGARLEQLPPEELFALRHKEISREFTKYFKRLRKRGYKFRYLLVVEAHKSGLPHYHALMHDNSVSKPLTYRAIGSEWKLGFYKHKLLPEGDISAVNYCTKYLMKSASSRVRASVGYGQAARF